MPHFWNNILVITYNELVPEFYKSIEVVKVVVARAQKRGYGIRKVKSGGGIESPSLIEYDSLPSRIKAKIPDPRQSTHILEHFFETDREAVRFFQNYRFDDGRSLKDKHQEEYIANASVLNASIKLRNAREKDIISKGGKIMKLWQTLCEDVSTFLPVCKEKYSMEFNIPDNYRRFREKVEKYEKEGYGSLILKHHQVTNAKKVTETILGLFESIYASQDYKPNFRDVYESYYSFINHKMNFINEKTGEFYDPKNFELLSESTIYNYLNKWKSKIGTRALRSGDRQNYMQDFKPYHSLEKPEYAGSIISIDDRQPPFKYDKEKRVWFYMGIDLGSECWTTWVWGKTKEGIIIDFYRQMVRNYYEWGFNIPFELEAESSLNSSFKDTFLREGRMFEYVRIEANNARGKRVERYFRNLRYGNEKKRSGWLARPHVQNESNQSGAQNVPIIPYEDIIQSCLKDIEEWNNSPHSEYLDKTRWEIFCENQHPELKPTNWRGIIPYLGYQTKSTCKTGIVKFQYKEFLLGDQGKIYDGNNLIKLMELIEGEQVDIYWLDDNSGKVMKAYAYIGDNYICELLPKPTYNRARAEQTPDDHMAREIMSKYVATIEAYGRKHKKEIERITIIDHSQKTLNNKFRISQIKRQESVLIDCEADELPDPESITLPIMEPQSFKDRF